MSLFAFSRPVLAVLSICAVLAILAIWLFHFIHVLSFSSIFYQLVTPVKFQFFEVRLSLLLNDITAKSLFHFGCLNHQIVYLGHKKVPREFRSWPQITQNNFLNQKMATPCTSPTSQKSKSKCNGNLNLTDVSFELFKISFFYEIAILRLGQPVRPTNRQINLLNR